MHYMFIFKYKVVNKYYFFNQSNGYLYCSGTALLSISHLFEQHPVGPDVFLTGSEEVLSRDNSGVLCAHVLPDNYLSVLHVDTVLEQHLVLLSLKLESRGVILGDSWVRATVDPSSKLESLPLAEIISTGSNLFGKCTFSSVVGHRPLLVDTLCPDGSLDATDPLGVFILVLDIMSDSVPAIGSDILPSSPDVSFSIILQLGGAFRKKTGK